MNTKKLSLYEKIVNILLDILIVIFGIILLISIYNNIQIKLMGNDYSSFFGYTTFEVQTGSMEDTISPGDWIIVKSDNNIELNEIVTYKKDDEFITHRVIEVYNDTYVTKGDANSTKDEAINKEQIVGSVVKVLPGFGIIRKTIFNPIVLIPLIITLYLFSCVLKSSKGSKKSKQSALEKKINFILHKIVKAIKENKKKKDFDFEEDDIKHTKKVKEKTIKEKEIIKEETFVEEIEEVDEEFEEEDIEEDEPEYDIEELKEISAASNDDLDKTIYFRMISVDKSDVDATNGVKEEKEEEQMEVPSKIEEVTDENLADDEVKKKLTDIQKKRKKFKNVIDKVMFLKREELNEIIVVLNKKDKFKSNESTIKEELLNTYINSKYYNYYEFDSENTSGKKALGRIDNELKLKSELIVEKYKGKDNKFNEKVGKFLYILSLINNLETIYLTYSEMQVRREKYNDKILKLLKSYNLTQLELKYMVNEVLKIQKLYHSMIKHVLDKLDSNTFELIFNKIDHKKKIFGVDLRHNINFNKVYSDYIVDKTYSEGIIAEDKIEVLISLLLTNVVKDIVISDFGNSYMIYLPSSIYSKTKKLDKIFDLFDCEYTKENIIVLLKYSDLISNKKLIKSLRKDGYHFALTFDGSEKIKDSDIKNIYLVDYIFADKKIKKTDVLSNIPDDLKGIITYEDVISKVSNYSTSDNNKSGGE